MAVGIPNRPDQFGDGSRAATPGGDAPRHSSLLATVNVVLWYRRLVIACMIIVAVALIGVALAAPRTYTSTAAFMPHASGGALAGLSNLAAQLGVSVGKEDPTQSPDFYAEVIKSRGLLTTLAAGPYPRGGVGGRTGSLADVLEIEAGLPEQRLEAAIKRLQRMIFVNVTRQTGIMHVNVTSPRPELSREIAERLLRILDDFNTTLRQNQAGAEEKFLEEREQEARAAQVVAEERVVAFLRNNREYVGSPTLAHQYSRLNQEALYRADVVATLTKARAQARIEAARNTPVITVLDRPHRPLRPDGRGLLRAGVLALVLGALLGIVLAFIANALRDKEDDEQSRQFSQLRMEALHDLRHPFRALLPRRSPTRVER